MQANGQVERCFGTLQDQRFHRAAACAEDAHKPLLKDQHLASILSYVEERTVANDYTISWLGQHYQIPLAEAQPRLRKARIRVEQRLEGSLLGRFGALSCPSICV